MPQGEEHASRDEGEANRSVQPGGIRHCRHRPDGLSRAYAHKRSSGSSKWTSADARAARAVAEVERTRLHTIVPDVLRAVQGSHAVMGHGRQ